jgi:heme-degrading monooxygenase HmoA
MIFELATITVTQGSEEAFENAVDQAVPLFQNAQGFQSIELHRSIENPLSYTLKVGWGSVDDHMVTFRESDAYLEWRKLVSPFFAATPQVQHVSVVKVWN